MTTETTPAVSVSASVDALGIPSVAVGVALPRFAHVVEDGIRARLQDARAELVKAAEASPAVATWRSLVAQIADAQRKVDEADAAVQREKDAQADLESNPVAGVAAKLRAAELAIAAATQVRAAAERDLDAVRPLLARHWPAANAAVMCAATGAFEPLARQLGADDRRAEEALTEAVKKVEEALAQAIAEHLVPALVAKATAQRSLAASYGEERYSITAAVRNEMIGPAPAGASAAIPAGRI